MKADDIGRIIHEANRAMQLIQNDPGIPVTEGWDDIAQEMRDSVIDGVLAAASGATPEELHENWLRFKEKHGWTYGPVKSDAAKTHPCLVPYGQLPGDQQLKDRLFHAIVEALA